MRRGPAAVATLAAAILLVGDADAQRPGREQRRGRRAAEPTVVRVHVAACETPNLLRNCDFERGDWTATVTGDPASPAAPEPTPTPEPAAMPKATPAPEPAAMPEEWTLEGASSGGDAAGRWIVLEDGPSGSTARQLLARPLSAGAEYVLTVRVQRLGGTDDAPPRAPLLALSRDADRWEPGARLCRPDGSGCGLPAAGEWVELTLRFTAPPDAAARPVLELGFPAVEGAPEEPHAAAESDEASERGAEPDDAAPPEASATLATTTIALDTVRLYEVPEPRFTMSRDCGGAPLPVAFAATGRGFPGLRWRWSFGDGRVADGNLVEHVYEHAGVFAPSLELEAPTLGFVRSSRSAAALTGDEQTRDARAPTVRVLGAAPDAPWLYWTEQRPDGDRYLVRSGLDGDEVEVLREIGADVGGLAVDRGAATLYWTENGADATTVRRSDLLACAVETVHRGPPSHDGLADVAVDESTGFVYWVDVAAAAVMRVSTHAEPGESEPVAVGRFEAHDPARPRGLGAAADTPVVAWTREGDLAIEGGIIVRSDGAERRIDSVLATDVAVHRRGLFAALPDSSAIVRFDPGVDGSGAMRTLCQDCGGALAIVVDRAGRRLYWIDAAGDLRGMFTARGRPGTMITGRARPRGLALYEPPIAGVTQR